MTKRSDRYELICDTHHACGQCGKGKGKGEGCPLSAPCANPELLALEKFTESMNAAAELINIETMQEAVS